MRRVLLLASFVVVLGAAFIFGGGLGSQAQEGSPTSDPVRDTAAALDVPSECVLQSLGTPAGRVVAPRTDPQAAPSIVLFDLGYDPCAFTIPADTPVTVTLRNEGTAVGNFVVDELGLRSEDIPGGGTGTVTITAPAGIYAFYSAAPGQREAGRAGILIAAGTGTPTAATPVA